MAERARATTLAKSISPRGAPARRQTNRGQYMSILINKDTKVITQGITGKTGQFHTRACREYANGREAYVAGVNPKRAGEDFEGIPIYASVAEAKAETGATVSVIYVPPAGAAAAIWEAVEADLDLAICITEGIPVRDMIEIKDRMRRENRKTLLLQSGKQSKPTWISQSVSRRASLSVT
jgi:succinyl-CoA synthetase alpha subunit